MNNSNQHNTTNYQAVYKNTGTVPRTLHEAYRNGEYGYSIHLFKDDARQALEFFLEMVVGFLYVAFVVAVVIGVGKWLELL